MGTDSWALLRSEANDSSTEGNRRVVRGFILASLLFYQLRAKMKAQRLFELQKLFI